MIETLTTQIGTNDCPNLSLRDYRALIKSLKKKVLELLNSSIAHHVDATKNEEYSLKAFDQKTVSQIVSVKKILEYFSLNYLMSDAEIEGMIPNLYFILNRGASSDLPQISIYRKEGNKYFSLTQTDHWIEVGSSDFRDALVRQNQAVTVMDFLDNNPSFNTSNHDLLLAMRRILVSTDPVEGVMYHATNNPLGMSPVVRFEQPLMNIIGSDLKLNKGVGVVGLNPIVVDIVPFTTLELAHKTFDGDMSPGDALAMYDKNEALLKERLIKEKAETILQFFSSMDIFFGYLSHNKREEILNKLHKELSELVEMVEHEAVNVKPAWLPVDHKVLIKNLVGVSSSDEYKIRRNGISFKKIELKYVLERRAYVQKIISKLLSTGDKHIDIQVVGVKGVGKSTIISSTIDLIKRNSSLNICFIKIKNDFREEQAAIELQIEDFIKHHSMNDAMLVMYGDNEYAFNLWFTINGVKYHDKFAHTVTIRELTTTDNTSFLADYNSDSSVVRISPLSSFERRLLPITDFTETFLDQIYQPADGEWNLVDALNILGSYLIPKGHSGESLVNTMKLYSVLLHQKKINRNKMHKFRELLEAKNINLLNLDDTNVIYQCSGPDNVHNMNDQWMIVFDYLYKQLEESNDLILNLYREFEGKKTNDDVN